MQPWEPLFYIIWSLISTFQQSAWEKNPENNTQAENGDTSTIPACKTDRSKPCHSHACPNLFVPRAETAALLTNSCERGNDMQTLSTGDFFTKQRKYLWYNAHLVYHSLCEPVKNHYRG